MDIFHYICNMLDKYISVGDPLILTEDIRCFVGKSINNLYLFKKGKYKVLKKQNGGYITISDGIEIHTLHYSSKYGKKFKKDYRTINLNKLL